MIKAGITRTQADLLAFIRHHVAAHGYSPTFKQMMGHMGYRSKGAVAPLVDALVQRGYVTKIPGKACSIFPVEVTETIVRDPTKFRSVSRGEAA